MQEEDSSGRSGPFETLYSSEAWWRDHYSVLQKHGYMLRPRFRPGWTPSWIGTSFRALECEDGIPNHNARATMDASRISNGQVVCIKRLATQSREFEICRFLAAPERIWDPHNPSVPIIDWFSDDSDLALSYIVMPLLRRFDDPPFHAIEEVLDFMQQTLEGLLYVHANNIAHRDLSAGNIMLDGKDMYPRGFHPALQDFTPSFKENAKGLRRNQVSRVKYYFIDWGLSSWYTKEERKDKKMVVGVLSADPDVPELGFLPYDPFLVDIFSLGNLFKKEFVDKYTNLEFFRPLSEAMTSQSPNTRPTAEASYAHFMALTKFITGKERRWHLRPNPAYKSPLPNLLHKPQYSHRRAERLSQIREVTWQLKNKAYSLVGRELIWPVPNPAKHSGQLSM